MSWIPVEKTFNEFVSAFGGELVCNLLPSSKQRRRNADYLFRDPPIVAELKCLEKDTFTPQYYKKLTRLAHRWRERGLIAVPDGTGTLHLQNLPTECQQEWLRLVERPLQRHVMSDANAQIKQTKETLNLPQAKGLLIIVSDGNYSLQPYDVTVLVSRLFKKKKATGEPQYSSIHGLVYFTVNMTVKSTATAPEAVFWLGGARDQGDTIMNEFEDRLELAWYQYRSDVLGDPLPRVQVQSELLEGMRFIRFDSSTR